MVISRYSSDQVSQQFKFFIEGQMYGGDEARYRRFNMVQMPQSG